MISVGQLDCWMNSYLCLGASSSGHRQNLE